MPDLPIGLVGWCLGPHNLGGLWQRCLTSWHCHRPFIYATTLEWSVCFLTKSSPSLSIFKTRLNSGTKASHKYFHIGDRKENIIHCQMRNDASNLNRHLQQHHLSDRSSCPHCNNTCECPSHYFGVIPLKNSP